VRTGGKEKRCYLADVGGNCRVDLNTLKVHCQADSAALVSRQKTKALTGWESGPIH